MKKKKFKRIVSVLLMSSVLATTSYHSNMENICATSTEQYKDITFMGNTFSVTFDTLNDGTQRDLWIAPSTKNTAKEIVYPSFTEALKALKEVTDLEAPRWSEKMRLSSIKTDGLTSVTIPSSYYTIPSYYLDHNGTIENVNITTDNDITLTNSCIKECKNLKKISIHAPNKKVTIEAYAIKNLDSLQELTITAGNIVIDKDAFVDCTVKNINLNGTVAVNSKLNIPSIDALSLSGTTSLPNGFLDTNTINSVSLSGSTNIAQNCFSGCNITNLNLEGTTTLGSSSFNKCTITNMSVNGKTVFADKTLDNSSVKNLYFNLDNRNNCKNISYVNGNDRIGYNSKVNNIYFNYANINNNFEICQELNNFELGDTPTTSLCCDNIYFFDANFKYINGSSYKRTDGKKTNVYAWGGAMAWDVNGNRKSAYDMYKEWIDNDTCVFFNYVKNTNSGKAADVFELKTSEVYIPDNASCAVFNFEENITAWANFESQNNQYAEKNDFVRANNYSMKPLTMNVDDAATNFSTNFNYRILKKDDSITGLAADKYNYLYSSSDETKGWYTALTTTTDNISEGNNYYLLEVGGVKYPFTITGKYNTIEKLSVESTNTTISGFHLTVGDKITSDMLTVTATYSDGTINTLSENDYEIVENSIKEGNNTIVIKAKKHATSNDYISTNIEVTGYADICTGFNAHTDISQLYEGGSLTINDVTLTDVTYQNPNRKDEKITSGFKFIVDGQESDTYTIKKGENVITISYKGYKLSNAFSITGIENKITKIEAIYTGTVYEGSEIATDTNSLSIYIFENNQENGTLLTDNSGVTFDPYIIEADKENLITLYYKGIKAAEPLKVIGMSDNATQIVRASYNGSTSVGYTPIAEDIYLQAVLSSGKVVSTTYNPEIIPLISINETVLTESTKQLTITFKTATYTIPITVDASSVITIPTQSAIVSTPTPTTTATVIPTETSTGAAIEPSVSNLPVKTDAPTPTETATITTATPIVPQTTIPVQTPMIDQSANTPITSTGPSLVVSVTNDDAPVKGNVYTLKGIKYKILTISKTKETGTVSIVGYQKSASSIKLVPTIKIKGFNCTVTKIANNAFKNCTKLKGSVSIAGTIASIGNNAFIGCKNISKVIIGSKVKIIGSKCFYNCPKLKTVNLKNSTSLSKIGASAFKKNAKNRTFLLSSKNKTKMQKLLKGKK